MANAPLNEQKYNNNIRTVSGAVTVFDDDVILAVDTSAFACTIDLGIIPEEKWSTVYKLYIYDTSGNASTNNITINAAAGQTINGQNSVLINADNGAALIRIVGTDRYSIVTTFSAGTVGGHTIEDEGNPLAQRPTLNFIGGGVEAYDDGLNNETVVDIIGGVVQLTNADMLALISAFEVKKSQLYLITDALYTDFGIIVTGTSENSISREGRSLHFNADYNGIGDYSGVATFTSFQGQWNPNAAFYPIGVVVVYNNLNWINTGIVSGGTPPDSDPAWQQLLKTNGDIGYLSNQGYIFQVDFSIYDVYTNIIHRRSDSFRNVVDYSNAKGSVTLEQFPWGNPNFSDNKISGNQTSIEGLMNQIIEFKSNILQDCTCSINGGDLDTMPSINENYFGTGSTVNFGTTGGNVWNGEVSSNVVYGSITMTDQNSNSFQQNFVGSACSFTAIDGIKVGAAATEFSIIGNVIQNGFDVEISDVSLTAFSKTFSNNSLSNTGKITISNWSGNSVFEENQIQTILQFTISNLTDNTLQGGQNDTLIDNVCSTFPVVVDFSDPLIYNAGKLDLGSVSPSQWNYVGRFLCINSQALAIDSIENAPANIPFKLIPWDTPVGNDVRITFTAIGGIAADEILNNQAFTGATIFNYYASVPDEVEFERIGNFNALKQYRKWL